MDFKNIEAKIKKWVLQLQALPDGSKKAILWIIVVVVALTMIFFWTVGVLNRIKNIGTMNFDFPEMELVKQTPAMESLQNQNSNFEELQSQINAEIINQQ